MACRRSIDSEPQEVRAVKPSKRLLTSGPTSRQHGPSDGPIAADAGWKPASRMPDTSAATTPLAAPRHPAWATPTAPGACTTTPAQSAVNIASGSAPTEVNIASASP